MKSKLTAEERKARQQRYCATWYAKNKDELKSRRAEQYQANRKARIAYQADRYFGIPDALATREALWHQQNGLCALCERPIGLEKAKDGPPVAHLDHDHASGQVRDVLCPQCNAALGCFNDDIELLKKAVVYLQRHALKLQVVNTPEVAHG